MANGFSIGEIGLASLTGCKLAERGGANPEREIG